MNLRGWQIEVETLPGPVRGRAPFWNYRDEIFPSPNGKYGALVYTIVEFAMGWENGQFALEPLTKPAC